MHDIYSLEASPFYVPGRRAERTRFGMAAIFVAVLPFGPGWGQGKWTEIAPSVVMLIAALAMLLEGLRLRRHRIKRMRAVEELWQKIEVDLAADQGK